MFKKLVFTVLISVSAIGSFAHDIRTADLAMREWKLKSGKIITASYLLSRNDSVFLQDENMRTVAMPMGMLGASDQGYVKAEYLRIRNLNVHPANQQQSHSGVIKPGNITLLALLMAAALVFVFLFGKRNHFKLAMYFVAVGSLSVLYGFKKKMESPQTDPSVINQAFVPFQPNVFTSWGSTYFYVESKGIPTTHQMMIGITAWQQQVPIPQCYTGSNAWSIPLNPVIAATPVPVSPSHFLRGAIAIAANGVPIFNPYTNTGVDAYLDGQLDNWGGHCGRADDYHYHIAPLHLYGYTANTLPIAYALDGFAVYGAYEPDGSAMTALDANHGHYGTNGVYHYHGSSSAPYMIGNMVGQVTEDATLQIVPQAAAHPVRPSLTPLNGAVITNCVPNANNNGYTLTYTRSGQTYQVDYNWSSTGVYTFNFISPTGTTTSTYNGFVQCSLPVVVPVRLLSFNASLINNEVQLKWSTSGEVNTDHFSIERMTGGSGWSEVGRVMASGGNNPHDYVLIDNQPEKGDNLYRLKIVAIDGQVTYSPTQKIRIQRSVNDINIIFTPQLKELSVRLNDALLPSDVKGIAVADSGGKMVYASAGYAERISAAGLAAGIYHVRLQTTAGLITRKIFVK